MATKNNEQTIKININPNNCNITLVKDLQNTENNYVFELQSNPELVTVYFSRGDVKTKVQTYPALGPLYEITWSVLDSQNFEIHLSLFKCNFELEE